MEIQDIINIKKSIYTMDNHLNDFDDINSILIKDIKRHNSEPLISIVIPTFNSKEAVRAIQSAFIQDFNHPYEIIIVDNCSEDIKDIINFLDSEKTNANIKLYQNQQNIGIWGNWNRCIQLASAEYIVYLHSDDFLTVNSLTILWDTHNKISPMSAVIGRQRELNELGETINTYTKKTGIIHSKPYYRISKIGQFMGDLCNGCGSLVCKKVMIELGGWNPDFHPFSDRVLFHNYADKYNIYRVNEITRNDTFNLSLSKNLYNLFPYCKLKLSKDVIDRYFLFKKFWHFIAYQSFIVYKETPQIWDQNTNKYEKIPLLAKIIDKTTTKLYNLVDKTFF